MSQLSTDSTLTPIGQTHHRDRLLLFLLGTSGNAAQWNLVIPKVSELPLDKAYGAPILPHPAFGESRPTVIGVASAIVAQLRRDGRRDVLVVAHSVGAFVAFAIARVAPDIVSAVIVVNGGVINVAKFIDRPVRTFIAAPRTCLNALRLFIMIGTPTPAWMIRAMARSKRISRAIAGGLVSYSAFDSPERRLALMAEGGRPEALRSLWDNRHHWREFAAYAEEIETEVTFLAGGQDPLGGEEDTRAIAAMLPKAKVVVLAGIGHAGPLEAPEAVSDVIMQQGDCRHSAHGVNAPGTG